MGYVETVIFFIAKFPYKWYQSYGFIIVTLDWIHGNAWEDKRKGKIYEWFIADLRVLDLLLWWDVKRFGHVKFLDKKIFSDVSFKMRVLGGSM
jgi:hypothetical protein